MKVVKEILYEKFTEESDPIADMGIGAKFVYYRLFKADQHFYVMYIYGDSFNVRDILKKYNFKWDDQNRAWKSRFSLPKELWEKSSPKMFEEIEKIGGHVVQHKGKLSKFDIDMERSFYIPGYEHSQYPPIPDGNGAKVYFKQWHHHAPIIGVVGKGSYIGKAALKYDGYQYNKGSHMWERTYDREDVDDLIKYFESRGYTVIDGRRKLEEKFTEKSDPIKDLGIGRIDILKETKDLYDPNNVNKSIKDIQKFLNSLKGKKITGRFKQGFFEELGDYEFVIDHYEMYFGGGKIELYDENNKFYYVIPNTQYKIG